MNTLTNCYKVKLITRADDEDYIKALKIYEEQTPVEIRTNSNEISYWIDNGKENEDFTFMVFAVYLDNTVIGFSETAYFSKNRLVLFDYITFSKDFRVNAVFFPVFSLIKNYITEKMRFIVDYWITEISDRDNGKQVDRESAFLKKLIYLENFCYIDVNYIQPQLGDNNYESSFNCKLYLQTNGEIRTLSKETVNNIVKSIYYSYYYNWYAPFLAEESKKRKYRSNLDNIYKDFQESISSKSSIPVKYNTTLTDNDSSQTTSGSVPASINKSKAIKYVMLVCSIIVIPVVIVIASTYVLKLFKVQTDVYMALAPAIISAIIVWLTNKRK
ncbi:hypothetical protein ACX93W_13875 [Paenibacillus sp. CAU 1782]